MKLGEVIKQKDTYGKVRSHTVVECFGCKILFAKPSRFIPQHAKHFCTYECRQKNSKDPVNSILLTCSCCNIDFLRTKSYTVNSKSGLYFCSRDCKDKGQSVKYGFKEIWPDHYGDGLSDYRNTVERKTCNRCGYTEHPEILQVHHKNRDRKNNNAENLEVLCPNCHILDHYMNKDGLYNTLK